MLYKYIIGLRLRSTRTSRRLKSYVKYSLCYVALGSYMFFDREYFEVPYCSLYYNVVTELRLIALSDTSSGHEISKLQLSIMTTSNTLVGCDSAISVSLVESISQHRA